MTFQKFVTPLFALTLSLAVACSGTETAYEEEETTTGEQASGGTSATAQQAAAAPADAATVTGLVKFEGTPAPMPNIPMGADPFCTSTHPTPVKAEDVVVGPAGELANVFVYVKDFRGAAPAPAGSALLDQQGCQYKPHVSGVQVGQTLEIKNSDATLHNVHAMAEANPEFNIGQPVQGMVSKKTFEKPEVMVKFKCDVHGWMNSYVAVLPHPYFGVSGANGSFTISGLPPGSYTLEAWHEKYGTQTQQVQVGAKESKQVSFTFKG
jgi:plastocyanin